MFCTDAKGIAEADMFAASIGPIIARSFTTVRLVGSSHRPESEDRTWIGPMRRSSSFLDML